MLFNSYVFLFAYLPLTILIAYFLMRFYSVAVVPWLLLASLVFYGWWDPSYLSLLLLSILFNFLIAKYIVHTHLILRKKIALMVGITGNLSALFYFKYTNFFLQNANALFHSNFNFYNIILPLGISFFTFTQIAFLIDAYHKKVDKVNLFNYSLFVTYFPHLIAGPIIHHSDVMPQFKKMLQSKNSPLLRYFIIGLSIFAIGLFKKVCIADILAPKVDILFQIPGKGYEISMLDAWTGALGYTFQLYFDFSGYSDMAIGLSYMLGIKLPINFFSPYKAINIIDFWRRWHMTLSRFFRDYLYIPLGGSRRGAVRKYVNLFIVMVIVGFWHGAGWTFILWGIYHGSLLILNHGWHALKSIVPLKYKFTPSKPMMLTLNFISRTTTFFCVVIGWVMFRANDLATAKSFYAGMFHYHHYYYGSLGLLTLLNYVFFGLFLFGCAIIAFGLPNNIELMKSTGAALDTKSLNPAYFGTMSVNHLTWAPRLGYGLLIGAIIYFALTGIANTPSSFLYFNF
ncbi:MBOAT family O-acyltransferase [Legionella cardiaca]|uniref:Probable alginate O-acetylase n=1 Tax=Legionella cardiaca TaxID=1071983 RepID=A0ABY8AQT0_9GAMM|nr:MBOAT family O-acyltransferase [Legionella cardiaca]WED42883.1 MBOAT family protein [Legionella cardiaca]